jgi:hypothetical protein
VCLLAFRVSCSSFLLGDGRAELVSRTGWWITTASTKHTRSFRTGLPEVSWGALYAGIPQGKAAKQQVDDTTGFVEGLSSVDVRQLELYDENKAEYRSQEARAYIESMSQELMSALFYHNSATDIRKPKGLGARYGVKATSGAGAQIIDAGGTGSDNTSIWFVEWGFDGLSAIYPKGTTAGIKRENKGEQKTLDADGLVYFTEDEKIAAHVGFSIGDWQRVTRIANIDVSEMKAGNVDLYAFMRNAYWKQKTWHVNKIHDQGAPGRIAIYCNRDVAEALDGLASNAGANDSFIRLRPMEIEGREVDTYRRAPIRVTEALLNTEARVV